MPFSKTLALITCGSLSLGALGAAEPYAKPDGSWISLSGTVASPSASAFSLDYGEGIITVEMDDWDDYGEAYGLMDGDKVTVYGRVDDDLYETITIEASSVYVENLNTYFYASSDDEEDFDSSVWMSSEPIVLGRMDLRGQVTSVDPAEREFTVDAGLRKITVDTDELGYNPLDELGYQKIEVGDRVSVSGDIDYELFDGRVLDADHLITLSDNGSDS